MACICVAFPTLQPCHLLVARRRPCWLALARRVVVQRQRRAEDGVHDHHQLFRRKRGVPALSAAGPNTASSSWCSAGIPIGSPRPANRTCAATHSSSPAISTTAPSSTPTVSKTAKFAAGSRTASSASCSDVVPGLFSQLKEVYLFGCNTLKSDPRHVARPRSRAASCARAIRRLTPNGCRALLNERYGESNRDRLRHIFKDVPVLYGFSSKAPLGRTAGPLLERYFQTAPAGEIASGHASPTLLNLFRAELDDRWRGLTDCRSAGELSRRHVRLRGRSTLRCTEAGLHARGASARHDRRAHVPGPSGAVRRLDRPGATAEAGGRRGAGQDRRRPPHARPLPGVCARRRRSLGADPHDGVGAHARMAVAGTGAS